MAIVTYTTVGGQTEYFAMAAHGGIFTRENENRCELKQTNLSGMRLYSPRALFFVAWIVR